MLRLPGINHMKHNVIHKQQLLALPLLLIFNTKETKSNNHLIMFTLRFVVKIQIQTTLDLYE